VSELGWAETPADRGGFWRRCLVHGLGLGLIAGALELVAILQSLRLSMDFGELLVLGLVACALGGLLGLVAAAAFGGLLALRLREDPDPWTALCAGLVAASLTAWHLIPLATVLIGDQDRWLAGVCFLLGPVGIGGVVTLHGRYGLRKAASRELPPRLSWLKTALLVSGAVVGAAALAGSSVDYGSARAVSTDTSVLLITVDTLRKDHVSTGEAGAVPTPNLQALAARGVVFDNAITPLPETAPAHAAMLTGRHPARLGMRSNSSRLARGVPMVQEQLAREGYATGAFLSSFALDSRTGLDQGFQAYDDDFFPMVRGLAEVRLARLGIRAFMRLGDPLQIRPLLERSADETCARALRWVDQVGQRPFFLWVHLFEPHSPYETHDGSKAAVDHAAILAQEPGYSYTQEEEDALRALYAGEVAHTDQIIGDFLDRMKQVAGDRSLAIVFTSDHGEMLGEHRIMFNHHGIWDETIKVPLIIVPPDDAHAGKVVAAQVRLMDLSNTILSLVKMDPMEETESADLTRFFTGDLDRDLGSLLMGRTGRSLEHGTLFGYRAARQGAVRNGENLKYIWQPDAGTEGLYDLVVDPGEQADISASQPAATAALRAQIEEEVGGLRAPIDDLDQDAKDRLRALGYLE
jgi:arylsulfatase A-like enzyme